MTTEELQRLRELCDQATPGPWAARPTNAGTGLFTPSDEWICWEWDIENHNAAFIAASREALPKLLDEVERLKKIIARELSENDELGSEFTYVIALKEENAQLRKALEEMIFAGREAYDNGYPAMEEAVCRARKALEGK